MPVCLHCDRKFVNREALHQHIASSSIAHPLCEICDRRFISDTAREAHMTSKHPPTYDCTICERSFGSPGALDDHYRGSVAHPNCSKCGKGFKDFAEHKEHRDSAHVPIPCGECGGAMIDPDAQEAHYMASPNHPVCLSCERGFKDNDAYAAHLDSVHPEGSSEARSEEEFSAAAEAYKNYTDMSRDIYQGARGFPQREVPSWPKFKEATTEGRPLLFQPLPHTSKDFGLRYPPARGPFASRVIPLPPIATPPRFSTKFAPPPVASHRPPTARQAEAPPKSLPPPGEAMTRLWGKYENVQGKPSFLPPSLSRRSEAAGQPRSSRSMNGSDAGSSSTVYSERVLSWRVPNGDRVSRLY